ncbi:MULTISPECIES: hypothetical protein [unclassified Nonomuraea]|uniref:hypothetical protein n=1 Tax=unclassified Nonomuraea TaxID=2593643 RepID=UPI001378EB57|nr:MULTISPECIES: hypothetical protein [unclassified Nonomuraea]NBE95195.1 hypothetical protein [Nonomuraea sp. K271]
MVDRPDEDFLYVFKGRPACGGLPRVGRSLAALRLSGRSRPALAPTLKPAMLQTSS